MVGLDTEGAVGLRNALGAPVADATSTRPPLGRPASPLHLSRPELIELLVILFVLAVLTVVAGVAWTQSWYFLAPVIAALLGIRVATTRTTGRFAWSVASVLWFVVLLVPALVLVALLGLLVLAIIHYDRATGMRGPATGASSGASGQVRSGRGRVDPGRSVAPIGAAGRRRPGAGWTRAEIALAREVPAQGGEANPPPSTAILRGGLSRLCDEFASILQRARAPELRATGRASV